MTWSQQAFLKASNTAADDNFGTSVAVSGDTVVVGASSEDSNATGVGGDQSNNSASDSGAAYVFVRSGVTWSQQAYLKASNTDAYDSFGMKVAVSGDTVVVGASGESSNATGVNGIQSDNSSASSGAAYVFVRSGGTWSQQAYLKASNTSIFDGTVSQLDFFGSSVAVSGDTAVVGASGESSNATGVGGDQSNNSSAQSGAAYVFIRSGGTWSQQAYLKASNTDASDGFGASVTVSGDTVVVGASSEDSNATGVGGVQSNNSASGSGAAYVFIRSGGTWSQQSYLKASNTDASDGFGTSVAVSGATVVVGASGEDSGADGVGSDQSANGTAAAGAAYVFAIPVPTVTTPTSTPIYSTSATLGGNVTAAGGTAVTARGVVYAATATTSSPLLSGSGVTNVAGTGTTGVFTVSATGLTASAAYSYAAYATNSEGTAYTTVGTFTTKAAPTVASVSVPSSGTYAIGSALTFYITWDDAVAVTVTGTPTISFTVGSTARTASYNGFGSGSTLTFFSYAAQAGDLDTDGIVVGSLALNGGTLQDGGGGNAVLTLNSIDTTTGIMVDGIRPTAGIVVADTSLTVGETSLVTITFSEAVTGFANADLTIANGTLSSVASTNGGITWTATLTPTASVSDATNVITLANTGVTDAAGNAGTGTTVSNNYAIDTVRPTAGIVVADTSLTVGETSLVTITFTEAVTGFANADLTIANGTLTNVASADGGITWTATLTPNASVTDATNVITLANTGVTDAAGNAGTGTTDSNNYAIDTAALAPIITSAIYNVATRVLAVTAADLTAGDTIAVGKLTLTGEGAATRTLTTASVTASSATAFSITLNDADAAALSQILNKNGTSSTGGTTFNLAAADDWNASVTNGDTADATNAVTVANVAVPTLASATYDGSTGELVVTGTGFLPLSGASNDIDVSKLTITGDSTAFTLTTASVELTSSTSFTVTLNATDRAALATRLNQNGTSSVGAASYNLAAAEDWAAGAAADVTVADLTNNLITASNVVPPPVISSTLVASGTYGSAIATYAIAGTNTPTSYSATGLPAGLALNTGTGAITGTPTTTVGSPFNVTIGATNSGGTGTATLVLTINKAPLTVTADAKTKIYGAANPTLTATLTGFVNGETLGTSGVTGAASVTTTATALTGVGSATLTAAVGNLVSANYAFTTYTDGALTITKAPLTVTADAKTKIYGAANPALTATITGFKNSETTAVLTGTPTLSTVATTASSVASYAITAANGTLASGNYSFGFVDGSLAVTKAPLTVTADNQKRAFGAADPTFNATLTGFVNSETLATAGVSGSAAVSTSATLTSAAGTYPLSPVVGTLTATNYAFTTFTNGTLQVIPIAPGVPTGISANGSNGSAIVSFTAPGDNGGSAITGYTVTATPVGGGTPIAASGTSSPITVTGLTNGTGYTFTLQATNAAGTSTSSSASAAVTPAPIAPGVPTAITVTTANGEATITFTGPSLTGSGAITGYTIRATAADWSVITVNVTGSPAKITGLTPGKSYRFTVIANNSAGASESSPATEPLTISLVNQTISFAAPADRASNSGSFALSATASSGLPVTFTLVSGPGLLAGNVVDLTGAAGPVKLRASQAGNATYAAAPEVEVTFTVTAGTTNVIFGQAFSSDSRVPAAELGLVLPGNGQPGFLLVVSTVIPGLNGLIALETTVSGGFIGTLVSSVAAAPLDARIQAAPVTYTITGTLLNGVLTGTIAPLGLVFTAPVPLPTGPSAAAAGLYVMRALVQATGTVSAVVGANNEVLVLLQSATVTTGGLITLKPDNTFALTATDVTLTGSVNPTTTIATATVTLLGRVNTKIDFSGLSTTTKRTDRLINLSSRAKVGTGESVLITGFVIGGTESKKVLIRAAGPALSSFGLANALPNSTIKIYQGSNLIAQNDDWNKDDAAEITRLGAFAFSVGSKDAALLTTLAPGAYTAQITDPSGTGTGVALAEIYDASINPNADFQRLVNISSRGRVTPDDGVLIGGFVVTGNYPKTLLVRGIGPTLASFGIAGASADPALTIYQDGKAIATNEGWANSAAITTAAIQTGAFMLPAGSKDAAVLITLNPGAYTAQIKSANNASSGVALIEIYEVL